MNECKNPYLKIDGFHGTIKPMLTAPHNEQLKREKRGRESSQSANVSREKKIWWIQSKISILEVITIHIYIG